jgi:hypothetical protein
MTDKDTTDYLEVDNPIPGQNYACVSFVSPEHILAQKELFMFSKYMTQRCGELENRLEEVLKSSDDVKTTIQDEIVGELQKNLKYTYEQFASTFEDFKYKYGEQLESQYSKKCDFKTTVRGLKVRGVFDTRQEADNKAKELQRQDRSFHVFVGQVGFWLPWDPCADKIADEEYLESDLNTMMRKYKENEVSRDIFYEEEKRDKMKKAMEDKMAADKNNKEIQENLEDEDPWLKSKFSEATIVEEANEDVTTAEDVTTTTDSGTTDPSVKEV